nr:immunoglobulin light chain junction region [Macaca mulatta]MOX99980.1 immunoglobulin light chain junction region [Macaca mulatta]MOY03270.1 immunoglobulin light chain junction region [Macaca mulatta]
CLQGFSTPFTF